MVSQTKAGHETLLTFSSLEFDEPVSADIFTRQNLERHF